MKRGHQGSHLTEIEVLVGRVDLSIDTPQKLRKRVIVSQVDTQIQDMREISDHIER
jgi:hypothetical protein